MAIHNSFSQSQTNRQYIFLYKIWEITLGKLVWRDIFCSHFSHSHQKQKITLHAILWQGTYRSSFACRMANLMQRKAKLRQSSTNGRASPPSAAALWWGTPTLSYSESFQTGPACFLCPRSLHLRFVPFVSGSSGPISPAAEWFFRKPSWFSMVDIIVEGISFKFSKVISEDWRFWEPIQALYGRYKTNYCPRNCSQTRIVAWISMNHNSFLLKVKSLMCIALFILCKVYVYQLKLDVKTKTISYQCSGAFLKSTFSKVGEENVF